MQNGTFEPSALVQFVLIQEQERLLQEIVKLWETSPSPNTIPTVRAGGSGLSLGGDTGHRALVKHLSIPPWPPILLSRADVPLHTQHPCFNLFGCLIFLIIDKLNEKSKLNKDPEEAISKRV